MPRKVKGSIRTGSVGASKNERRLALISRVPGDRSGVDDVDEGVLAAFEEFRLSIFNLTPSIIHTYHVVRKKVKVQ